MPDSSTSSRTVSSAVRLLVFLLSLAVLAACTLPGQATPAERAPAAATSAARPAATTVQDAAKAPSRATAPGTSRARATATSGSSAKPQPVPGLTIPAPPPNEGLATIAFDRLPIQARDVIRLIAKGGPFPYRQDGIPFENRERILPQRPAGYYKEYTVETPGSPDRGARRIVAGKQGELYYTGDHYATFKRVVP